MARMIPPTPPADITNPGERLVAAALLEQLPAGVEVYHSYPWLRPDRDAPGAPLKEGEADFVIVHPSWGMLVLEVKSGKIDYLPEKRRWVRLWGKEERPIKDPFVQVRTNQHALVERVKKLRPESTFPGTFGHAVVFPECRFTGTTPPGADPAVLLTEDDLLMFGAAIERIYQAYRRPGVPVPTPQGLRQIRSGLQSTFRLLPLLARDVAVAEERLARLTVQQQHILEGLYDNQRVLVRGGAGTGKTLLAVSRARAFAGTGLRTLLLCYNRGLAEHLQARLAEVEKPEILQNLQVRTFHGLCRERCVAAGIPWEIPDESLAPARFWNEEAPALLEQALAFRRNPVEAIVVDEAQDFAEGWWRPIEFLGAQGEKGPLYIFYDPAQNLFGGEKKLTFPLVQTRYRLRTNCRNTRRIAQLCRRLIPQAEAVVDNPDAPEGEEPRVLAIPLGAGRQACGDVVRGWTGSQAPLRPEQIAVLSPLRRDNPRCSLFGLEELAGVPVIEDLERWRRGQGILFATVRRFKGLEADALVLCDIPAVSGPAFPMADLYVACSRARHRLVILTSEPAQFASAH